ncbi:hypothetical protein KUTeg_014755 [Tegillarca granosa]|uniref:Uncharacterized protein n=1 Tax=Tegillarca granosa TaxID=220873 RepID=A0ABQ9EVH6_TEGGR|nr:hypothetical protein KUTeg_014755 [Tegillarca granosa]
MSKGNDSSTIHDTDTNTYEGLDDTKQESGANTYETITNKRTYTLYEQEIKKYLVHGIKEFI